MKGRREPTARRGSDYHEREQSRRQQSRQGGGRDGRGAANAGSQHWGDGLSGFARSFAELPDCVMKLICMVTLLLSDADLGFTYISFVSYYEAGFMLPIYVISLFTLAYLGGAYLGAREGLMFYQRFRRTVQRNGINNLKIKHLDMYMAGGCAYTRSNPVPATVPHSNTEGTPATAFECARAAASRCCSLSLLKPLSHPLTRLSPESHLVAALRPPPRPEGAACAARLRQG